MLITGLKHLEVLSSHILNGSLELFLDFFDFNRGINQLFHSCLEFCYLLVGSLLLSLVSGLSIIALSALLPREQDLKMVVEVFRVLEASEDVVARQEVLEAAIDDLVKGQVCVLLLAGFSFFDKGINFIKVLRNELRVLVINFS